LFLIDIDGLINWQDLLHNFVTQMAEGEITPEEAAVAASAIETKRKALETGEFDRRLTAIEQQLDKGK
jgi:hypothetical protein